MRRGGQSCARLYARGLEIADELLERIVNRTAGVSAAFIKELTRRCAQFEIELTGGKALTPAAVDSAIEEMLFAGGTLNRRLLGGGASEAAADSAI